MELPAEIESKLVDSGQDDPLNAAKVVIVQTGDKHGDDDNGCGDLYFALSNYEHEDDDRSDNMTAKNEDGNDLSLVYSERDASGCHQLDNDELAGLKFDSTEMAVPPPPVHCTGCI